MNFNPLKNKELGNKFFQRTCSISFTLHGLKRRYFMDTARAFTLGRSPECDICIRHPDLAPVQCRFEPAPDGGMILFTENTTPPTLINGFSVPFKLLEASDKIKIGSIRLEVDENISLPGGGGAYVGYDDEFGPALIRTVRKSHWFLLPAALYALVIWLLWDLELGSRPLDGGPDIVQMGFGDTRDFLDLLDTSPEEEPLDLTPPEPLPPDFPHDVTDTSDQDGVDFIDIYDLARIPQGSGRSSPGVGGGFMAQAVLHKRIGSGSRLWKAHMGRLRATGMDVAILFDSTGSMSGFIQEVKGTIEEMILVMKSIVPDIQICLMTYKGEAQSSPYVVANTPLVKDPYEILNFMRFVEVGGGSAALCSAIGEAMKKAQRELVWRDGTTKALVIIGDAPPFLSERAAVMKYTRRFKGKVSTIYKASSGGTLSMEPETTAIFQAIAKDGKGAFIRYDTEGDVVRHIVSAVLDPKWEKEIHSVFEQKRSGRWANIVQRKLDEGDVQWLLWKFREPKVRPELVNGLIELGDERVAREMWRCLGEGDPETWLVQRALFVLQSLTGMRIGYDESRRERLSKAQFLYIAENLKRVYGSSILEEGSVQAR